MKQYEIQEILERVREQAISEIDAARLMKLSWEDYDGIVKRWTEILKRLQHDLNAGND